MKAIKTLTLMFFMVMSLALRAQTPTDAFTMEKGQLCPVLAYQYDTWEKYWEGSLFRINKNLGTVTSHTVMPMFALGLNNRFTVIASFPWMQKATSAGTLNREKGWQDLSLWLKALVFKQNLGEKNSVDAFASVGYTAPLGGYYADYLPLALGSGSNQLNTRLILTWRHSTGIFASVMGGYDFRSNIDIDRTNYYIDQHYLTNELYMPNVISASITAGYFKNLSRVELKYNIMDTDGGQDIRRNDQPYPSNNMDNGRVELFVQQRMPFYDPLGVIASVAYTTSGRNVPQALSYGVGLQMLIQLWK